MLQVGGLRRLGRECQQFHEVRATSCLQGPSCEEDGIGLPHPEMKDISLIPFAETDALTDLHTYTMHLVCAFCLRDVRVDWLHLARRRCGLRRRDTIIHLQCNAS